jgi:hypothetical protein
VHPNCAHQSAIQRFYDEVDRAGFVLSRRALAAFAIVFLRAGLLPVAGMQDAQAYLFTVPGVASAFHDVPLKSEFTRVMSLRQYKGIVSIWRDILPVIHHCHCCNSADSSFNRQGCGS